MIKFNHIIARFLLVFTLTGLSYGYSKSQAVDTTEAHNLIQHLADFTLQNRIAKLNKAAENFYDQGYYDRYLSLKMQFIKESKKSEDPNDIEIELESDIFKTILKSNPDVLVGYYETMNEFSIQNQLFKQMQKSLDAAIRQNPLITKSDTLFKMEVLFRKGRLIRYLAEYEESIKLLKSAIKIADNYLEKQDVFFEKAYYNLGCGYAFNGDAETGVLAVNKALAINLNNGGESEFSAHIEYNALGLMHEWLGKFDEAIHYHEQALHIKKHQKDIGVEELLRSYNNLATVWLKMEQPQKAYQSLMIGLRLIETKSPEVNLKIWFYINLAQSLLAMNRPIEAIPYLNQGLLENTNKFDRSIDGSLNEKLGIAYSLIGQHRLAIKHLKTAKQLFYDDLNTHQKLVEIDNKLSEVYLLVKDIASAKYHGDLALKNRGFFDTEDHPLIIKIYNQLGEVYYQSQDFDRALLFAEKSKHIIGASFLDKLKNINLKLKVYQEIPDKNIDSLRIQGDDLITSTLEHFLPSEERYLVSIEIKKYHDLILKDAFGHLSQIDTTSILNIFDKSKNNFLKSSILSDLVDRFANIPKDITDREVSLLKRIRYLENFINYNYNSNDSAHSNLILDLENCQESYASLVDSIKILYPSYFNLKYNSGSFDVNKMQGSLDNTTAIIDYIVGEENIWIAVVTKDVITFHEQRLSIENRDLLFNYQRSIADGVEVMEEDSFEEGYKNYTKHSIKIFDYLLKPIVDDLPKSIESLTIIPDGILNYIPFESLLIDTVNVALKDYRKLNYLVGDYEINYTYALSLRSSSQVNKISFKSNSKSNYIGFAPQYSLQELDAEGVNFPDLPAARELVKKIAGLYKGTSYVADNASLNSFKEHCNESTILHLAMHCIIDNEHPMQTRLVFSGAEENDSLDLSAAELYGMNISNDLSVLTACNTGSGKLRDGEGVISLSRAFSYAGSNSLVMSLWSVPDKQSSEIMTYFFENLNSNVTKSNALQDAKLRYLAESPKSASHPFYWSGFVLSGNNDIIKLSLSDFDLNIPLAAFTAILLLSVIFLLKKKYWSTEN